MNEELKKKLDAMTFTEVTRAEQLKLMHKLMCSSNDENITMNWLMGGVPDGADEWDYYSIATDEQMYNDCCDCFVRQINEKGWRY